MIRQHWTHFHVESSSQLSSQNHEKIMVRSASRRKEICTSILAIGTCCLHNLYTYRFLLLLVQHITTLLWKGGLGIVASTIGTMQLQAGYKIDVENNSTLGALTTCLLSLHESMLSSDGAQLALWRSACTGVTIRIRTSCYSYCMCCVMQWACTSAALLYK